MIQTLQMRSAAMDKSDQSWCPAGVVPAEVVFFLFDIDQHLRRKVSGGILKS